MDTKTVSEVARLPTNATRLSNRQLKAVKATGKDFVLTDGDGLRSMASTILNEHGWDPELIEVALAHVDKDEVRSAYNRADYIERRRPMMVWWSEYIQKAATGNLSVTAIHGDRSENVAPIR